MKYRIVTIILFLTFLNGSTFGQTIDSMQRVLDTTKNQCLQAELCTNLAAAFLHNYEPKTKTIRYADAGKAAEYSLRAVRINFKFHDTIAALNNFDALGAAYFIQKKYAQAKWYILQSSAISRDLKDVPQIINSLVNLAEVKIAIKDYKLAESDFREAIVLSVYKNDLAQQIAVEKKLTALYILTGDKKGMKGMKAQLAVLVEKYRKEQLSKLAAMQKGDQKAKKTPVIAKNKRPASPSIKAGDDLYSPFKQLLGAK